MKRKSLWNSLLVFCLIGFGTIASFISCEVGLGSAVDVAAPDINITTPPTAAVIRQSFAIAGDWSDDGTIKSLEVTLKNTNTKKEYKLNEGNVKQQEDTKDFKGTWDVIVDPLDTKNPIPDGSYEATISITDNGKHKTQITRSFVIDNTPPVVVLQRPSSKAGDSISDLFGQTLSLTGQAADDNNIKEIHINFYSDPECTDKLLDAPIIKKNIPPTISLDVAKFEEDILNDYAKIYGSIKKEGKKPPVYYTITAYDEAQRFPITEQDAKEDDSLGNATDTYYLYDDIYAEVLADFKVTNIYSILNGSFTDSDASRAASAQNIPEILKNYKIKAGKFQLNPANNPEFKVVGREGLEKDENGKLLAYNFANPANDLTNESNITVKIDVGLDAIPLNIQTLRVYLLPVSADGSVDDKPENRIYPEPSDPPYEKNGTGYTFTTKIIKDACKDKDGNAVTLTVGNPYVIAIEGYDSMKNEAVAEEGKVFGFRLAPNGAAPILDINTSINSAALSGDSMLYVPRFNPADTTKITSLRFEGTVTVEDGVPTVEYSIDGGARSTLAITATGNKGEFSFEKAITVDDFVFEDSSAEAKKKSGQHNIIFYANQTQDATPVKKTLMYQVDGPKVTMSRLNPTAYNYYYGENGALVEDGKAEYETINGKDVTKKYLNGKNVIIPVTIMAGAVGLDTSDAKKPVIEFIQGGETKLTMDAPDFGDTDPIDTTKFAEGELLIRITAYDQAGNKGTAQETYYVKQATDVPVILPKNSADSTIFRTKEQVADSNEKNIYSANQTVSYRLIDDDGLKSAAYEIWRQEAGGLETQMKTLEETKINLNETTDYQLEIKMEDTPATYRVLINTTDKNNLSHPGAQFFVRVTASAPTIDEISLSKTLFKEEVIEPQIVIKSDQKPFILSRVVKDPAGNEIAAYTKNFTKDDPGMGNLANESPTVGDHIEVSTAISSSGRYSVEYLVEDVNGKKSSISEKFFNVDLTAPVIDEVELNDAAITSSSWYNSTTLTLTVDVSDAEDVAGTSTSTVEYSTDDKAWDAADKIWTSLSYNSSKQKYSGSAVFGSEGDNNKLFVRATDKAGNVTYHKLSAGTPDCDTIKIDGSAPELTVSSNQTVYVKSGDPITVSGTYEDPHSGVNDLTFNIDGTAITPTVTYTPVANGADTWTTSFVPSISGKLGITGHNKAGLATSELKAFDIMIDTSAPQNSNVKFGAYKGLNPQTNEPISEEAYLKPADSKYYVNNNKDFVISGVSTDDTGIKSVTLKVENNISQSPAATITPTKNGSNSKWYFTFNMDGWSTQAKATVTVTDNAGRTTTEVFDIVFDKTAPKALHQADSKNKDIYFRIGRADNDKKTNDDGTIDNNTWETGDTVNTANNPKNEEVGKKYSYGTWGNDSTIEIRGTFEEKGAGLKAIHYAIFDAIPTAAQITALENGTLTITENNHVKLMSSFAPLATPETKKVPYNTASGKEAKEVTSNFRTQLSGFDAKNNYLVLIAEDNAGNRAADTLAQTTGSALDSNWNSENHDTATPYYTINKDTTAPTITSTTPSKFTNGKAGAADLVITGTATDDDAKVAYVTVTIEDESLTFSKKIEAKDFTGTGTNNDTWTATISATKFSGKSGAFTVYAEAVDNAGVGNKKKISAATINVDIYGPTVKIIAPSDKTKVGTQFELKGTANDGTGAGLNAGQKVTLYYTKKASLKEQKPGPDVTTSGNPADVWVKLSEKATLTDQDWNYTIDFANIRYNSQSVAPADANTTLYIQAEAVDSSGTGNHGFADKAVEVVVDRKAPVSSTLKVDETDGEDILSTKDNITKWFNSTTVNLNGTFTDDANGVKSVKYNVLKAGDSDYADANIKTIASDGAYTANVKGLAAGTNKIKVWSVDTAGNASAAVEYTIQVDATAPTISSSYTGVIYATSASCPVNLTVTDGGASGLKDVKVTIGTYTATCTHSGSAYTTDLQGHIPEGTTSVTATATDNAGNVTSQVIANVMLDTKGPELVINTPAADAKTSNIISLSGSVSDGTGSGVKTTEKVTLYYTKSSTAGAKKPGTDSSSAIGTNAASQWVAYGTKMNIIGQTWSGSFTVPDTVAATGGNTPLYISAGAIDNAGGAIDNAGTGNKGYSTPMAITVDRKAPVSSALKVDETDGEDILSTKDNITKWFNSTTVNMNGTFTDDASGVKSVRYNVLKAGDSDYADTNIKTIASDGTYTENVKGLAAGINKIKVWSVDTAGNASAAVEYTIQVDATAPTISSNYNKVIYASSSSCPVNLTVTDAGSSGLKSVKVTIGDYTGTCTNTSGSAYTIDLQGHIPEGTSSVTATATDNAGNETSRVIANVMLDTTAPTVVINTPSANAKTKATISLSGSASDGVGSGIKESEKVTLYYTTSSSVKANSPASGTIGTDAATKWVAYGTKMNISGQTWSGSFTVPATVAPDNANTTLYLCVGAVDNAGTGNKGYSTPVTVVVDKAKPAKSLFKVGTTAEASVSSTWFNNETLNINGTFTDAGGSGVSAILYTLDGGTEQEIPTTDGTFNTNIAGFTTGEHTLAVRAVDKVGLYSSSTSYTIQVDMSQPEISEVNTNDFTAITLTNGTGTRTFKFNVTDSGSGFDTAVSNIEIKAGSRAISNGSASNASSITVSGNTVTVELGATDLAAIATTSGTYSVTAKVKDIAGNESNAERIGVLKVDKDLPVPNFTSHNHKATVNKQITLSGTVTDTSNSTITAMSLTATCGSTSKVYGYPTGTDGNITYSNGQWSYILNTTDFNNTVNAANMTLTLTATDAAGNTGSALPPDPDKPTEPMTLSIDQNSDRPEVKLTSVKFNADGSRFGYVNSEITGTLSDDDGIPTEMAYRLGTSGNFIDSEDTNSKLTYSNVDGSFSITLDDDEYDLYFKIKDSANGEFVSKVNPVGLDLLSMPILKDKIGTIFGANDSGIKNTIIKMTIDTNTPDVETPEFTIDNGTNWQIGIGSQNFGGTKKNKFKIRQNAYDKNTVKRMTVKVIEVVNGSDSATPKFNKTYDTTAAQNPYVPVSINKGTKTYLQFTSDEINVTGWKSTGKNSDGNSYSYRLEITMSDGIKESITKLDLSIDNTAPVISFSGPAADSVNSGEITVYGTTDELGEIYYTVSTDGQNKPSSDTGKTLVSWSGYSVDGNGNRTAKTGTIENKDVPEYVKIPNAGVSWYVYFDGNTTDTQRAHGVQLKNFASILGLTNDLGNFKDLVNFYIWIKVDDAVGNSEEYPYLVCVDPQGDRPSITLSNPETPGESVGGTVKLYGTAEDSNGTVESVWVQLLSKKNNGTGGTGYGSVEQTDNKITSFSPTSKDLDFWNSNGYTVAKMKPDNNGNHTEWTGTTTNPGSTTVDAAEYGIQANFSGTSWSLKINSNSEFNPDTDSGSANDMAVRIFACDDAKNLSYAVTRYFKMDNDTPVISNVMLKQYAQNDTTFESSISSQEARIGMYVKGKWYLEFTANDDESLDSIVLTDSDGNDSPLEQNLTNIKTKNIRYELPTANGVGSFKQTIKATDKNNHTGTYEIEINYDNEAPKLLMDTVTEFGIDPNVHQSNGFYRLSSKVSDASVTGTPSGVKAVGFYFMRREAADEGLIYDPMQKRATPLSTKNLTYADGLYWISGNIKCKEDGSIELQTGLSEKAAYIHTGSYIRLDGVMYKITTFDGTNKITIEESHASSYTTAQIALALFVDNQKSEYEATTDKNANGYYTSIKNDDGDGMVEELGGTSALATWSCSIVSSNIPDGPIEIHYTAYDAALNYAVGVVGNENKATYLTYSTSEKAAISGDPTTDGQYASYVYTYKDDDEAFVSNNAPRLAGVIVATDTNGNGRIDEGENGESISTWNSAVFEYTTWDKSQKELIIPADSTTATPVSIFTTKGLTKIEPEIIGGNGELMYNYTVSKRNSGNTDWATPYYTQTTLATIATQTDATYQGAATVTPIEFTVKDFLSAATGTGASGSAIEDADNQKFTFTIWDSTDGTTCGTNSQKAKLDIVMSVKLRDTTPPEAKINPFFWTSLNENSIYGSDAKDVNDKFVVKTVNELAGHVELEPNATTNPDLSGKVVLRGTASDTRMIKSLYISIPEMATEFGSVTGMTKKTVSGTDYYLAATYDSTAGEWTTYGALATNGFAMKITKSEFDADGHSVEWEFDWDTTAISAAAPAKEGIVVKVLAEDEGKPTLSNDNVSYAPNTSAEGSAQTTSGTKTAKYTVDVVPYITEITRENTISGGAMNRSKLGSYPVSEGETLIVTGFNLIGGTWTVGSGHDDQTAQTTGAANIMDGTTKTGKDSFTMTVPAYSGNLTVTVGGVESVNNTNRTDLTGNEEIFTMKGSSVKYTAQDNRYLAVWNLGNYFKNTNNGAELQKPVMTADKSGNLYASWAAQSNSNIVFSYGVKENKRPVFRFYDQPSVYTSITFDTKGTSGGALVGFIPEHQGAGGMFGSNGMSNSTIVGGMGAVQIPSDYISNKTTTNNQNVRITGNPKMFGDKSETLDPPQNLSSWYNLANYDMNRRLGSFESPGSARYGNYLHTIWFDNVTEGLKYSVVDASDYSKYEFNSGGIVGWIVIDGGYTGQDRVHEWDTTNNNNTRGNNTLRVSAVNQSTSQGTGTYNACYKDNIFYNSVTRKTTTSVTVSGTAYRQKFAVGDTIALLGNTGGDYQIALRTISSINNMTINWTEPYNGDIDSVTIYGGNMNVVGGTITENYNNFSAADNQSSSAGKSSSIDVDTNGRPVIVYQSSSDSTLRIARFKTDVTVSAANMGLAANWTRTVVAKVSCSGEVSAKVDSGNNLHIMYKNDDGQLCYLFGTPTTGNTYNFNAPEIIDETGSMDYGTLSVIETATTRIPCVTYLNSAGTAQAIKYAVRSSAPSYSASTNTSTTTGLSENWDFMILPSLGSGHYAVKENQVSLEARKTGWTGTDDTLQNGGEQATATPLTVQAAIAFKSTQFETAYLKTE